MKKILEKYGVTSPIEAIPTGVDIEALQKPFRREDIRKMWQIPENKKILLYVSRMAKEKNVEFLLKAFYRLEKLRSHKHERNDTHLLMVGGGPEINEYKELVKKWGLESAVTFTDMVKPELTKRYYGIADIFVFPSVTETQGIVVTEAQGAGVPVVAVNKMGPSDLVKNGEDGYLTDLNIHEFVAKINKLLNDEPLRRKLAHNARQNAKQYSSLNCAMKMEKLYNTVIKNYALENKKSEILNERTKDSYNPEPKAT
jgi:glycosyltransferase involved in cell wall biosynthesis